MARFRKYLSRFLKWLLILVAVVLVGAGIVFQTEWGRGMVRDLAEREAARALVDARLEIGKISGSLLWNAKVDAVRLYSGDSLVVAADTVEAGYNLPALFFDRLDLGSIQIAGLEITARQRADSTWDLPGILPEPDTSQTSGTALAVSIAEIQIGRFNAEIRPLGDSSRVAWMRSDLLSSGALEFGNEISADDISAGIVARSAKLSDTLLVSVNAGFAERRFRCSDCMVATSRSLVRVDGYYDFESESSAAGADLTVRIDSLALADLSNFYPPLDDHEVVDGRLRLIGPADSLSLDTELNSSRGEIRIAGVLIRRESTAVDLVADFTNVDPSRLWENSPLSGRLNADVSAHLQGPSIEELTGAARLEMFDSNLNGRDLRDTRVTADFAHGLVTLDAVVELPALHAEVTGEVVPFADTAQWDVSGSLRGRGFDSAYPAARGLHEFDLRYEARGGTASRADYFRDVSLLVDKLVYRQFLVDSTALHGDLTFDGVRMAGVSRLRNADTGRLISLLDLDSSVEFGNDIAFDISRLSFDQLDVGLGSDSASALSRLAGVVSGSGTVPAEGLVTGSASGEILGDLMGFAIDSSAVVAAFVGDLVEGHIDALAGNLKLSSDVSVELLEDGIPVTAEGRVSGLDVGVILADTSMSSDLSGSFRADVRWVSAADHRVILSSEVDRSRMNQQEIMSGSLHGSLQDGSLNSLVSLSMPEGGFNLDVDAMITDSSVSLLGLDGDFSGIKLGDFLGMERLDTDINGSVEIAGDLERFEGFVRFDEMRINRATVDGGRLAIQFEDGTTAADLTLNFESGRLRAVGTGQLPGAGLDIEGMVDLQQVDVAALAGIDSLGSEITLGCSVVGYIGSLEVTDASGFCLAGRSNYGDVNIDSVRVEGSLSDGSLVVETARIRSNVADVDAAGLAHLAGSAEAAPEPSDLRAAILLKDLTPLERPLGLDVLEGEGTLELTVRGGRSSTEFLIEPRLEYLTYNDYRISSIDGFVQSDDIRFSEAQAVIDIGFAVIAGFPIQQTSISLLADPSSVIFAADVVQRRGRRGSISATYVRSEETPELLIDDLTMNLAGTVWQLQQTAEIEMTDVWTIRQFLIYHDDGQIALDGHVDLNGDQNLIVTAEEVETSAFIDLFGVEQISGALEGYLVLEGPATAPIAQAAFRVRNLSSRGQPAGDLNVEMNYADGRMDLDGAMNHVRGSRATVSGSIPVDLTLVGEQVVDEQDPLDLIVQSDSLPIAWTLPLLGNLPVDDIGGRFIGKVEIGGSWDDPAFSGGGTLSNGKIGLPDFNTVLTDMAAAFDLSGNELHLNSFIASTGDGRITGSGDVNFESLDDLGLDLDVDLKNFKAIATNTYRFTISGSAKVGGSMRSPIVTANVAVGPADVFMTEELLADEMESVGLTDRDIRILERRFGYRVVAEDTTTSDFVESLKLDANVSIGRDVWLRSSANPAMDIEFSGDLRVVKNPFEEYGLVGSIDVNPSRSRIIQFARRFGIDRGTVTFNGLIENAVVDFRAEYIVPSRLGGNEVRILLSVTGVMEELELEVSSEPQMDDATIASYLLTGRPPDQATVSGEQAAEIAIGGVSRLVEAFANENFGLDVVEIEASGTQGARLTVGKYISPRTYIFVTQPLSIETDQSSENGSRSTQIGLEYELFNWLIAEVSSRRGSFRGNLRWQISY